MARVSRTLLIFGGFSAAVGAAFYPIYFRPLRRPEEYSSSRRPPAITTDLQPIEISSPADNDRVGNWTV